MRNAEARLYALNTALSRRPPDSPVALGHVVATHLRRVLDAPTPKALANFSPGLLQPWVAQNNECNPERVTEFERVALRQRLQRSFCFVLAYPGLKQPRAELANAFGVSTSSRVRSDGTSQPPAPKGHPNSSQRIPLNTWNGCIIVRNTESHDENKAHLARPHGGAGRPDARPRGKSTAACTSAGRQSF